MREREIFLRARFLSSRGNFRKRRKKGDDGVRRPGKSVIKMYEGFLRDEKESSTNRCREGKKLMTREKLRTSLLAASTCCRTPSTSSRVFPFPILRESPFFPSPFIGARNADTRHVGVTKSTPVSAFPVILFNRVAESRDTLLRGLKLLV